MYIMKNHIINLMYIINQLKCLFLYCLSPAGSLQGQGLPRYIAGVNRGSPGPPEACSG
jgi:hypothetical protein